MSTVTSSQGPDTGVAAHLSGLWSRFWFTPADPTLLGVIRVCIGLLVLYVQFVYTMDLQAYFGEHAWIDLHTINSHRLDDEQPLPGSNWGSATLEDDANSEESVRRGHSVWSVWFHVTDPATMERINAGILVVMVLFTVGLWTRVTAVLTWLAFVSGVNRVPQMVYGMDITIGFVLFYLMIGPCGAALSLDRLVGRFCARRNQGTTDTGPVASTAANFCLRLMQIHFCFMYLMAGLLKLQGSPWWNGTAVWNTIVNYELSLVRYAWFADALRSLMQHRWLGELLLTCATAYTLVVEIGFPFLVWYRKLRWPMITAGVLLHLGIAGLMGLELFSLAMMIMLLCFIPPEQARAAVRRLFHRNRDQAARLRTGAAIQEMVSVQKPAVSTVLTQ